MGINHARLWAERKYVDLWTIPHLLAGVVLVGLFEWFGLDFWLNFVLSFLLIVGWEFFELIFLGIHEHITNKVIDVVSGLVGFFLMYGLIIKYSITSIFPYLMVIISLFIILNIWGYIAYEKRTGIIS